MYLFIYYKYFLSCSQPPDIKGNIAFIVFTIIWLFYSIIRIESLVGFHYFEKFSENFQNDINKFYILKYIAIFSFQERSGIRTQSTKEELSKIINDNKANKEEIEQAKNYFIALITTVLIMIIISLM